MGGSVQSRLAAGAAPLAPQAVAGTALATVPPRGQRVTAAAPVATPWSKLRLHKALKGLAAHDLVTRGVSVLDAQQLMKAFKIIDASQFFTVLGINPRTMQRRALGTHKMLDPNASDRALRLMAVTSRAIDVLGSQEAAERWLSSPAMGLEQRKPLDLVRSTEGTEMVKTLLGRMEYGVYA